MQEDAPSHAWKNTLSVEDIDERATLEACRSRHAGADIVDALLDLYEQRMKRRMEQMEQGEQGAP
jgi:hypothetical protein